jgi:hypothetical protein
MQVIFNTWKFYHVIHYLCTEGTEKQFCIDSSVSD